MGFARQVAFDILLEVEQGGYAADLLAVQTAPLEERDAGLAGAIVLGALRYRAQIDFTIGQLAGRPVRKLDAEVLAALRIGVFQLRYLDRIPSHAAVDASVELVKRARKRSAAGFVNAVLRKVKRDAVTWPDRETELSCPEWMLARWEAAFGAEAARGIALAALETPVRSVRVPERGISTDTPFRVQDIGSQSIVPLLDLREGQRFLDLCAAPGNKTAQALETPLWAVASDVSRNRLEGLRALGIPLVRLDAAEGVPFSASFDAVLVDAPCTGTGTLGHNPEIKWRLRPEEIARQAERQIRILKNALDAVTPGGTLVYSTCSLEPEENEAVIQAVTANVVRTARRMPGREPGDGFFAAVIRA